MGECLPRRSTPSAALPAFAAHLRLRSARFCSVVRPATPAAHSDHRVHARRLCSSSTRAGAQTQPADHESSPGHGALLLSLPYRARDPRRQGPVPAPLYQALSTRLRPAPPGHRPGPAPPRRSPRHRAPYGRRGRQILGHLPHLPRSWVGGLDAARRPTFLRGLGTETGRRATLRGSDARPGERQQAAARAPGPGNLRGSLELLAPGEADDDQLTCVVRFSQRPPTRPDSDGRWAPLAVPSSSGPEPCPSRQPPSISTFVRTGYGAGRDVSACPATADGSLPDRNHHALREPRSSGRLE